jgi:signal peptidase
LLAGIARGGIIGALLVVVAPAAMGWRTMTVMSGSMSPTIRTGDAVVAKPVAATLLRPGDVATFKDPEGTARLITHRVLAVAVKDGRVHVTTRGDANNTTESWDTAATGSVGRVVYRIPRIGFLLVPAASPFARLLLVALPVVLLGVLVLIRVWRSREPA